MATKRESKSSEWPDGTKGAAPRQGTEEWRVYFDKLGPGGQPPGAESAPTPSADTTGEGS